jgi:hypothetical protein
MTSALNISQLMAQYFRSMIWPDMAWPDVSSRNNHGYNVTCMAAASMASALGSYVWQRNVSMAWHGSMAHTRIAWSWPGMTLYVCVCMYSHGLT